MWSLGMMIQSGKDNVVGAGLPSDPGKKYGNFVSLQYGNQVFTLSSQFTIEPQLYTRRPEYYYAPLIFKEYLNKIGKTSLEVVRELYVQHNGMKLCQCVQGVVMVNRDRKPTAHPDWFLSKYKHVKPRVDFKRYTPVPLPNKDVYKSQVTVQWSDTDYNYHTNQFSYMRFVIDCFHEAVYNGAMTGYSGDPTRYKVKLIKVIHTAQSAAGDTLNLYIWNDVEDQRRIYARIDNGDDIAYQGAFQFFTDLEIQSPSKL